MKKFISIFAISLFILVNPQNLFSQTGCKVTITEAPQVAAPTIASDAITQPTCTTMTGSVQLTGLPATGTWSITCSNGTVVNGSGSSYNFTGLLAGNSYTFIVTNADGCNSTSSVNAVINTTTCLSVLKEVDNSTPSVGSEITFKITVTNNGPNDATGVTVTDVLPTGYAYISNTTTQGAYDNATGLWSIGNLANGASVMLTIKVKVNATGSYANTATVTGNENDPKPDDNTSTVTTDPTPVSDLSIVKSVNNSTPAIGNEIEFAINVTNNGPSAASNVTVTDVLPTGYAYISNTATQGAYDNATGLWTIGNLANGASATLTIRVKVNATGNYTNTATVTGNESDPDSSNNEDTETITTPNQLSIASITLSNNKCFGDNKGTITVTAKGGTGKYYFSKDGGVTYTSEQSTASYTFSGLNAGDYYIVVKDSNNNIATNCP